MTHLHNNSHDEEENTWQGHIENLFTHSSLVPVKGIGADILPVIARLATYNSTATTSPSERERNAGIGILKPTLQYSCNMVDAARTDSADFHTQKPAIEHVSKHPTKQNKLQRDRIIQSKTLMR